MRRMPILLLACAFLTGCSAQKSQSFVPESDVEVSITAVETTALATERETEAPTGSANDESLGKLSYREVLERFYYDSELPGIGAVENMKLGEETNDLFAICDVDGDGSDELIIRNRDAGVADQIGVVYGHNNDGGLVLELMASESMAFYRSGCVKVFSAHNQGGSGFWPYTLYQYNGGVYEWVAFVEAFSKKEVEMRDREAEENGTKPQYSYPKWSNNSGEDFIYYITTDPEYYLNSAHEKIGPMDVTEYEDWYYGYTGGETEWTLKYFPLTEDNIRRVDGDRAPFEPVLDIDAGEVGEEYMLNSKKSLFFADDGYYYYAYKGGWDSAHYVLAHDGGDGNYTFLSDNDSGSDDWFWAKYYRDGTFYGELSMPALEVSLPDTYNHSFVVCAGMYRSGKLSAFLTEEGKPLNDMCFAEDYIYAAAQGDLDSLSFYRFDYDGGSMERIAELEAHKLYSFVVHGEQLICEIENSQWEHEVGVIDLETGGYTALPDGGVGFVCGGYMYYSDKRNNISFADTNNIYRMSLDDCSVEKICEGGELMAIHDDYLIYCVHDENDGSDVLRRLGNGEDVQFFDPNELLGDGYYYSVDTVQSEGGHLYVELSSGPYYKNIMEIDTNGNFIKQIYLNPGI